MDFRPRCRALLALANTDLTKSGPTKCACCQPSRINSAVIAPQRDGSSMYRAVFRMLVSPAARSPNVRWRRRPEGSGRIKSLRQTLQRLLPASGALVLAVFGLLAPACAQGRLEARYSATLAGIPIGSGSWAIDIADTQYTASANGSTSGILRAFTGGQGNSTAHGTLNGGRLMSSIYAATITGGKKTDVIRITINNGNIKDFKIDPPIDDDPQRVPVTEDLQHGVLDPMTASIVRMPGNGEMMSPEACQRTLPIFDGRLRYDMQFAFKRMDKVKADKGYAGPVVVCAAYFSPVAGYIPSRAAIRYLANQRDMEVWLAPIAGTRVLVPYRAQGPTPIGQAVLQATEFIAVPAPARASANGSKTE
jgi:hypothetical protein